MRRALHSNAGRYVRCAVHVVIIAGMTATGAFAQNYSFDARKIALGGVGGDLDNVASKMIDEQRTYGSIPVPLGLIQLFADFTRLNPANDEFDPARTFEYVASPIHFTANRGAGTAGSAFIEDLMNGRIRADLSTYSGFQIPERISVEGLAAPNWGHTFRVRQRGTTFHGVYVGAGPYLPFRTKLDVDNRLRDVLGGGVLHVPNGSLRLDSASDGGIALAITGGYRGRFALPRGTSERDGIYVGVNYHHIRGFQYRALDSHVRFDTDAAGLIIDPVTHAAGVQLPTDPVVVDFRTSTSGAGFAADVGVGAVVNRWEFGVGANGIGNRVDWTGFDVTRYSLSSVLDDIEFVERSLPFDSSSVRTELPVRYSGNAAYHRTKWSAIGDVERGLGGISTHLGYEHRFGTLEVRGGGRYSRERWHPTGGVGLNLSDRVGLDLAAFTTTANIERKQKLAMAVSFRLNRIR